MNGIVDTSFLACMKSMNRIFRQQNIDCSMSQTEVQIKEYNDENFKEKLCVVCEAVVGG